MDLTGWTEPASAAGEHGELVSAQTSEKEINHKAQLLFVLVSANLVIYFSLSVCLSSLSLSLSLFLFSFLSSISLTHSLVR